jgi:hypothetical protein
MNVLDKIERQLSESVAARSHDDVERVLGATRAPRHSQSPTTRRLLRRRPAQLALAVALAGVLLVVGLTNLGSTPGPTPAAAAALQRLARIAASGPSLLPGPGQYLYVRSVNDYPAIDGDNGCVSYSVDHRQVWIAADGSGLLRESGGTPTFTSPADQALCQKADPTLSSASGTSNLWFAAGCFTLGPTNNMQSLSTDPSTLLAQMRSIDGGPHTPAEDFVHVGDFLRETDASPALRAALYRAAALIPGVQLLGTVNDHFGRQGLGVALTAHNVRNELIFNSQTAALMGEQSIGSAPGSSSWAVYLNSSAVDSQPYPSPVPLNRPCVGTAGHVKNVPGGSVITGLPTGQNGP